MKKKDKARKEDTEIDSKDLKTTKKSMRESTLQEIGDVLGLTRMRICQIEKSILEKIRKSGKLEDFEK